ncbi:MAG: dGTP triphosphohydrolase [Bacteroidota bacterium]
MLYRSTDWDRESKEKGNAAKPSHKWRPPERRDYARILHSPCFRRLQGKTQVFPNHESDFFRNRLTHSLEVAQVARSIADKLNASEDFFHKHGPIKTSIVELAGLAHDLGHPPFGHNGEYALNKCMLKYGGFEGNAQTLRLVARIEKKAKEIGEKINAVGIQGAASTAKDKRFGLNLTYRSLAAVLKYDKVIEPDPDEEQGLVKGYYESERELVKKIKDNVTGIKNFAEEHPEIEFKTLECAIMDVADDIAYSTFDLEDAFKSGFLSPLDMVSASDSLLEAIRKDVIRGMPSAKANKYSIAYIEKKLFEIFIENFRTGLDSIHANLPPDALSNDEEARYDIATILAGGNNIIRTIGQDGYLRTELSSKLIEQFISGVQFIPNEKFPALSTVKLVEPIWEKVEIVKKFVFNSIIMDSKLQVPEYRGSDIVVDIFKALSEKGGERLLPRDYRLLYDSVNKNQKKRVICDFIAGMTDRYVMEFYGRLYSENPQTVFKPLS